MPVTPLKQRDLRIISIVNRKGGVGKTVSSLTLGSGLAIGGERVLMVDGDPQGNLSYFFGHEQGNDLSKLIRDMERSTDKYYPGDYIIPDVRTNLDLLPSFNPDMRFLLDSALFDKIEKIFRQFFTELKRKYDWIIFDCSPAYGKLEKLIISASDTVIIPLEFQLFSVAGLEHLLDSVAKCGEEYGKAIPVSALIFNQVEPRLNRIKKYREIFREFNIPIFEVLKSEAVPQSLEQGKTVWEISPKGSVSRSYFKIVEKLLIGMETETLTD